VSMLTSKRTPSRMGVRGLSVLVVVAATTVGLPVLPGATASPPKLEPVEVDVPGWESVPATAAANVQRPRPEGVSPSGGPPADSTSGGASEVDADALEPTIEEWSVSDPIEAGDVVMVGADWGGDRDVTTQARTLVDGVWSDWIDLDLPDGGPDPGTEEAARAKPVTEPLWIGDADAFQLRTTAEPDELVVPALEAEGDLDFQASAPPFAPAADAASPQPPIVTRAQWGADESIRRGSPTFASSARFAVVHHTAGSNTYSCSQSASIVNGIYRWHVLNNGWNDVGYNFMVDKCGTIFEGRAGGVDRAVVGAHAGGWNTGSVGVSILGNFDVSGETASTASRTAVRDLLAWKFDLHRIDPLGSVTITGGGAQTSRYPSGTTLTVPTIVGHTLLNFTACPGVNFYGYVRDGNLGREVRARMDQFLPMPVGATPLTGDFNGDGVTNTGYRAGPEFVLRMTDGRVVRFSWGRSSDIPLMGDWNGDGRDTIGLFRDSEWLLRNDNSRGDVQIRFHYGRGTDTPLVGDWNGDGRDTAGVRRGWEWILRSQPRGGPADIRFHYGRSTDTPLVGDWNGDGRDTAGVHRGWEWILRSGLSGPADIRFNYGRATDSPVLGDWNRNGAKGMGVNRDGLWLLRNDLAAGTVHHQLTWSAR
jgi:hypothetical protein